MLSGKKTLTALLSLSMMLGASPVVSADDNASEAKPTTRSEYKFPQVNTPKGLAKYSLAIYGFDDNSLFTCRKSPIFTLSKKNVINDVVINPAGINLMVLTTEKAKPHVSVYDLNNVDSELYKFNNKKIGTPTAVLYTPDARNTIIASETGIHIFEGKKFQETGSIQVPFTVTGMLMSNNGYYLAVTDGTKVAVYNFEEKKLRKDWNFGIGVNDMAFNDDNTEFAVVTDDGVLNIYDTRNFLIKKTIDELGNALSCAYNFDGKYIAVATSPNIITIINLLDDTDRDFVDVPDGEMSEILFIPDSRKNTLLSFNSTKAINAKRMSKLEPYYAKLISDEVNLRMEEWMKMMPGETMEEYRARVTDESRAKQRKLFEEEISTNLAGDPLSMAEVSLGKYDRSNSILAVGFTNMPTIYIPVPEEKVTTFTSADALEFQDVRYGVMENDNFEIIYAKIFNRNDGETYIYDNLDRKPLSFMDGDDNVVSIEIIQQQQMEEMRLQELKQKVVDEAKMQNVISDHTNITVDSRVVSDFDANGEKILNYVVKFSYQVEPDFSVHEDFAPGKYHVEESGAAKSMLSIVKQAFENDLSQYVKDGKKLNVKISGTADGSPIVRGIAYDGAYGDFDNEPVYQNGQLSGISVNTKDGIKQNEQLAFIRAVGVKDYLEKNVDNLKNMKSDYNYYITVSEDKGGEFRRITTEFTFIDAF